MSAAASMLEGLSGDEAPLPLSFSLSLSISNRDVTEEVVLVVLDVFVVLMMTLRKIGHAILYSRD